MTTAQERLILAQAALIKAEQSRERKKKLKAERKARGTVDRGRERDNAHLAFIRRLPCVATFIETGELVYGCQAAHLRMSSASYGKPNPGGQRRPDDRWTTPLSAEQHRIQGDVRGEPRFWSDLGVNPFDLCIRLYEVSGNTEAAVQIIRSLRDQEMAA